MLDQYRQIKAQHRDEILFFRLGDFYEMFNEDALEASSLLDLTLTKRQNQPMCGIPYHAAKTYIARLLRAGKKIAICEQKPSIGKRGLMSREVIEVITPGTAVEDDYLEQSTNNYLANICVLHNSLCFAYLDVSTGEFKAYSLPIKGGTLNEENLHAELYRLNPREILVQQSILDDPALFRVLRESGAMLNPQPDWTYDPVHAAEVLNRKFGTISLKGFGFDDSDPALVAAGNLLEYVQEMIHQDPQHIRRLQRYEQQSFVLLDEATKRNLELVRNLSDSSRRDTLIDVIDATKTAGGARMLRQWLFEPLRSKKAIDDRLEAVGFLYHDQILLADIRKLLSGILDTERLISRLAMDKAHAKDLRALHDSMDLALRLFELLDTVESPSALRPNLPQEYVEACRNTIDIIEAAILDDPSVLLTEGNIIQNGYNSELDELRNVHRNTKAVLEEYLAEEKLRTGIQNLRIRYNRVIGYYLEVTRGNLASVPAHFIRRQSLVGGERYSTEQLGELESKINGAQEKIVELERQLFLDVRESLKKYLSGLLECSQAVSRIDCIASLAQTATEERYTRPEISEDLEIHIQGGRHPVVERCLPYGDFVPNSLSLSRQNEWFVLITGPNMAGKSTVLRQTALIVLLAHIGSFVPADSARIGLVDKIFCRVGAQDNLARGESTFLVEMHETAFILNTATEKSLVIMDEVGRGTGTLDGVSIAWAVSEYLIRHLKCRTLFATHYHELTTMGVSGMRNMKMAVFERDGSIAFPKRLEEGASSGSYGIHVARLAGLPDDVILRASALESQFNKLEKDFGSDLVGKRQIEGKTIDIKLGGERYSATDTASQGSSSHLDERSSKEPNAELFSNEDLVITTLRGIDIDTMTPLHALQMLATFVEQLKKTK